MISLTVKTLDSKNHEFTVEDDITVAQFKEKIAGTVNIPADTQRIIYCGRVLKDELKLNDYDVNGKVVHLVQRAPPSLNQGPTRPASPQPQRSRTIPNVGNLENIYLGSMHIPAGVMESGYVPPLPTHSLAASRLNVAKRMLRRIDLVLNQLENPNARTDQTPPEEQQEEVTPVFEARVIVPNNAFTEEQGFVLTPEVQGAIFRDVRPLAPNTGNVEEEDVIEEASGVTQNTSEQGPSTTFAEPSDDASATSERTDSPEEPESSNENRQNRLNGNAVPTSEMADLLEQLGRIQTRLAPFLEQYQSFMRQDPTVNAENCRKTQMVINRVSEILHFLGHAYHSLSDIIVRVRSLPPRLLLCRPILLQHSAVLQAGLPIQVEAQISLAPLSTSTPVSTETTMTSTTSTADQSQTQTSTNRSITNTSTSNAPPRPQAQVFRFPMGGAGVHVESIPVNIPGLTRFMQATLSTSPPTTSHQQPSESTAQQPSNTTNGTSLTSEGNRQSRATETNDTFNVQSNPNLEFFMEVTPEAITIDSLEASLLDAARGEDLFRVNQMTPPSQVIRSVMQMAGQIMSGGASNINLVSTTQGTTQPTAPPTESTPSTTQFTQAQTNGTSGISSNGQQSFQGRGNATTTTTSSTHTRSTPRPHVHLAQHAMQGFDPFLPCNSHHVSHRRRALAPLTTTTLANQNNNNNTRTQQQQNNTAANNPMYNLVQGILNGIQTAVVRSRVGATGSPSTTSTSNATSADAGVSGSSGDGAAPPLMSTLNHFFPNLQRANSSDSGPQDPTMAQLLQVPDGSYVEGESILYDLIVFLSRNLTISDFVNLNNGRLDPLIRIKRDLRNFLLSNVLHGETNTANIERGVNRLLNEMQPFLENLECLQARDNIDIVRSAQMLFRSRLPNILTLAASSSPGSLRVLVEQCRITARQFCALIIYSNTEREQGPQIVMEHMVYRYIQGIPQNILRWTIVASRAHLRQFLSNLSVPTSVLLPYIARRIDSATSPINENSSILDGDKSNEAMDVDDQEPSGSGSETEAVSLPPITVSEDTETVIGSEPWHSQVPADWVPIMTRDSQRQRTQGKQPAFSDAYLSGMPSKRRKIVTSSKPQGSLPQVITESVRRAVTATGLSNVANVESVSQAAGEDINIQSAYRDLLRSSVQSNLQDNEDFTPDRFPNATNYFTKP